MRTGAMGEAICRHRDLSVCKDCWEATPDLIEIHGQVFEGALETIVLTELQVDGESIRVSPGTVL